MVLPVPLSLMARIQADESDAEDLSSLGGQIEGVDCAITMRELRPDFGRCPCAPATGSVPRWPASCWAEAGTRRPPAARWKPL